MQITAEEGANRIPVQETMLEEVVKKKNETQRREIFSTKMQNLLETAKQEKGHSEGKKRGKRGESQIFFSK